MASRFSPLFTWRSAIAESHLPPTTKLVAVMLSLHMNERGGSCFAPRLLRQIEDIWRLAREAPSGVNGALAHDPRLRDRLARAKLETEAPKIPDVEIPRSAIYLAMPANNSRDKAIRIAGLGECVIRHVPMDAGHRMDAVALDRQVTSDAGAGLRPFLVVASAGTTDVGAVDPLPLIGDVAERHGLWMHIDGAYGAFFALCDEGRKVLGGMDRADSIVMDPHKGLFLPYGSGAVLVKDTRAMQDAHFYVANYMQDTAASRDEPSPADLSPELTKHFRGMRLWLPLKLLGVAPFRAALEEKLWLARYFRERLLEIPGFEVGPPPDLSVVTFRYIPSKGDVTEFNKQLVQAIHADGRVFLSSSMIDDQFTIRLAVLSFRTHLSTIDLTLEILREKIQALL